MRSGVFLAVALQFLYLPSSWGGGFEKATPWSGEYAGIAGAATGSVRGADSLFFNPAGLSRSADGSRVELSLNFSPTFSQFAGPVATTASETSSLGFSPIYGILGRVQITDRLGLGFGSYVVGGAGVRYEELENFNTMTDVAGSVGASNFNSLKPTLATKLLINEFGLGLGYALSEGWSLGASWRGTLVEGSLQSASITPYDGTDASSPKPAALGNVTLDGLKAFATTGFRLGVQYQSPSKDFGLGFSMRNEQSFSAEGTTSGTVEMGTSSFPTPRDITGGSVTLSNTLPLAMSVGGFVRLSESWILYPEVTFTQYSVDQVLDIDGEFSLPVEFSGAVKTIPDVTQNWKDQYNYRLGLEYLWSDRMTLRGGYVGTTAVVPAEYARATFSTPGWAHTFLVGAGYRFSSFGVDLAMEYSTASAEGTNEFGREGVFSTNALSVHTGFKFRF